MNMQTHFDDFALYFEIYMQEKLETLFVLTSFYYILYGFYPIFKREFPFA